MTGDFLKGYGAGAADMEAGRLVTKDYEETSAKYNAALAEVESLTRLADQEVNLRKAAEAKLAEVEKERDAAHADLKQAFADVQDLESSMDQARELAEERPSDNGGWVRNMKEIARLLSGDDQEGSHTEDEVGPTIWDSGDEK